MRLFSFGSNSRGQLGLGHQDDAYTPYPVDMPLRSNLKNISVAGGGNHTLILVRLDNGDTELYTAGDNAHGQCALPIRHKVSPNQDVFTRVDPINANDPWRWISAGWEFSILVTASDKVYVCGQGHRGELGLDGQTVAHSPTRLPSFPPSSTPITHLHSGFRHTIIVLSDGSIFGWGAGRQGQLGMPQSAAIPSPRRISSLPDDFRAVKAVCGQNFTAIINAVGNVVVLGGPKDGALSSVSELPFTGWKDITAGWSAIYILIEDIFGKQKIVSWGKNNHGQQVPKDLPSMKMIAAGSEHVLAVDKDGGKLYGWGWGEHGNLAVAEGLDTIVRTPVVRIDASSKTLIGRIVAVGAGCATSWVLIDDGTQ